MQKLITAVFKNCSSCNFSAQLKDGNIVKVPSETFVVRQLFGVILQSKKIRFDIFGNAKDDFKFPYQTQILNLYLQKMLKVIQLLTEKASNTQSHFSLENIEELHLLVIKTITQLLQGYTMKEHTVFSNAIQQLCSTL